VHRDSQQRVARTSVPSHPFLNPQNGRVGATHNEQTLGLRRLKAMLARQRWIILSCVLSVLMAVATLTWFWPRTYESAVTFIVDKAGRGPDVPALATLDRLGRGSDLETEIELIQSRRVLDTVVDRLNLHVTVQTGSRAVQPTVVFARFDASSDAYPGIYRIAGDSAGYWMREVRSDSLVVKGPPDSLLHAAGLSFSLPHRLSNHVVTLRVAPFNNTVDRTQALIQAGPVHRDANLVRLICKGPTAEEARNLCSGVARSYLDLRSELQQSAAEATAHFLRAQVAQLGQQLTIAEDSAEAFGRRHRIANLDQQATEEVRQLAALKAQREGLEAERSALAELIGGVRDGAGHRAYHDLASFPTFIKNTGVTELLQSLVELENRRSELAVRRTEENPELAALIARIGAIERQLLSYAATYEQGLSAQIQSLDTTLERGGRRLAVIPTWQAQTARLERRVSLIQDLYRLLETRLREAEVARSLSLPSVNIVDAASSPSHPTIPNIPLSLALGLLLGPLFGAGLALYREQGNTRIYDREELERTTSLPVVSMLPVIKRRGPLARISPAADAGATLDPGLFRDGMLVRTKRSHNHSSHRFSSRRRSASDLAIKQVAFEAFRSLGTDLHLSDAEVRSIMVTSAGPGEGKTFTACNLALACVTRGARVLLMDTDLRASGVSAYLHLPRSAPGLTDVLLGQTTLHAVQREFRVDGTGELWVITAGSVRRDSGALLEREEFTAILGQLRSVFDLVVLDTPPLNVLADAATIATKVDATLLVVRSGVTDRDALRLTLERLERTEGLVAGVVLNGVDLPPQYASYSYQHG
jgi:capsular exopolysaccharide synthesis family protein